MLRILLTSPTLTLEAKSVSLVENLDHKDSGTKRREQALHFWPWYSKADLKVPMAALSTSADGWRKWKFLPPHSQKRNKIIKLAKKKKCFKLRG